MMAVVVIVRRTDCGDDAGDFGIAVAAGARKSLYGAGSRKHVFLVFVRMSQDERRVFLLRNRHVEANVGHFHDVPRSRVQLDGRVWNVLLNSDQSDAVSETGVQSWLRLEATEM